MSASELDPVPEGCLDPDRGAMLAAWVEGLLDEEEARELEGHLLSCDACAERLEDESPLLPLVRSALREPRRRRRIAHALRLLAAAVLCLVLSPAVDRSADRPDLGELLGRANRMSGHGEFLRSLPLYEEILRVAPDLAEARRAYGLDLFRLGRFEEAAAQLRIAWSLQPLHVETGCLLVRALDRTNDHRRAGELLTEVESAGATPQERARVLRERARRLLELEGRIDDAEGLLTEALAALAGENSGEAHLVLIQLIELVRDYRGDYARARELVARLGRLRRALVDPPDRNQVANALEEEARADLDLFLRSLPGSPDDLDGTVARLAEALRIRRAIPNRWGEVWATSLLALARAGQGRLGPASDRYADAIALAEDLGDEPDLPDLLGNRAQVLSRRGDFAAALADAERAVTLARRQRRPLPLARSLLARGVVRHEARRPGAVADFREAQAVASRIAARALRRELVAWLRMAERADPDTALTLLRP